MLLVIAFFYFIHVIIFACGSIHRGVEPERFSDESRGRREVI